MIYKSQNPKDIVNRFIILEYLRIIGPDKVYEKVKAKQKKEFFYVFTDNETNEQMYDFNWEYLLFKITISELDYVMNLFIEDIEKIDKEEEKNKIKERELKTNENLNKQKGVSINVMDIARAEVNNYKNNI